MENMIEKLIQRGYRIVARDEASDSLRKAVIIDYNGNFGVSFAAIDSRGRVFEGGSHPPQTFRALGLARWRAERQKAGPLPIKVDTIK